MKRRNALAAVPAALYAAACHAEQDRPGTTPGASYPGQTPKDGTPPGVRVTQRVRVTLGDNGVEVTPQIFLLLLPKGQVKSSIKWDIDVPADHTVEINFVVGYEGDAQLLRKKGASLLPKRGPFDTPQGQPRGRYVARGKATLDSGLVDVSLESYWKYEVTVSRPSGPPLVVDPGGIVKDWP